MTQRENLNGAGWEYEHNLSKQDLGAQIRRIVGIGSLIGASIMPVALGTTSAEAAVSGGTDAVAASVERNVRGPREVSRLQEVVSNFDKDTHVYFQRNQDTGTCPVSNDQLQELAKFLGNTDYYLVVVSKAEGFNYTDPTGARFQSGKEAVFGYLGQQLFAKAEFANIKDDRISPPAKSASLLIITCDPGQGNPNRDYWWSASELHEKMGLSDEQNFAAGGRFFSVAVPYFKRGLFTDGVQATVNAIEPELNQKISSSIEQARQIESNAKSTVAMAATLLANYNTNLAKLSEQYPGRSGDLFVPKDLNGLEQKITQGQAALARKNFESAAAIGSALQETLQPRILALRDYSSAEERFAVLGKELKSAKDNEFAFTQTQEINKADLALRDAITKWKHGDISYAAALSSANQGVAQVSTGLSEALKNYNLDGEKIISLSREVNNLKESKFAAPIQKDLAASSEDLTRVKSAWEKKDPAYPELLRIAEEKIAASKNLVEEAEKKEAEQKRNQAMGLSALLLALAGTGFGAGKAAQNTKRGKDEAEDKLDKLLNAMKIKEEGLEALQRLQSKALVRDATPIAFTPGSTSEKLAKEARVAITNLQLFNTIANEEICDIAKDLIKTGGIFSRKKYDEAILVMTNKPVEFNDENRERIKQAFSERKQGIAALSVPLEQLSTFKRSMAEIDAESIKLAAVAEKNLTAILNSREKLDKEIGSLESRMNDLKNNASKIEELAKADGLLPLPTIKAAFIPVIEKQLSVVKEKALSQPIEMWDELQDISEYLGHAEKIAQTVISNRETTIPEILNNQSKLYAGKYNTNWISQDADHISKSTSVYIDSLTRDLLVDNDMPHQDFDLQKLLDALQGQTNLANALDVELRGKANDEILDAKKNIAQTRQELGAKLNLSSDLILKEEKSNPDDFLAVAEKSAMAVVMAISVGHLADAQKEMATLHEATDSVMRIIDTTKKAFSAHEKFVAERQACSAQLKADTPRYEAMLHEIEATYSPAVLALTKSDKAHNKADNTVANNLDELHEAINLGDYATAEAIALLPKGKILESAFNLSKAAECFNFATDRLQEISEKKERLAETEKQNAATFDVYEKKKHELVAEVKDFRVTTGSVKKFEEMVIAELESAQQMQIATRKDPFAIADTLLNIAGQIAAVERLIKSDREQHASAARSLQGTKQDLEKANKLSADIDKNEVPDSKATDEAQAKLVGLGLSFTKLAERFNRNERDDWQKISSEAANITAAIGLASSTMATEDEKGAKALAAFKKANQSVREANGWSGSYGISISGNPGAEELRRAQELLRIADYAAVLDLALRARKEADGAIESAEARVASERHRREEEARRRREEEERERREEQRRQERMRESYSSSHSSSSHSSWGGGSSGGSFGGGFGGGHSGGSSGGGW